MSFLETPRFPDDVAYGASGGPGYKTSRVRVSSGAEQRNMVWSRSLGKWNVAFGVRNPTQLATLLDFFHGVGGRAYGFRFKDWTDYTAASGEGVVTALGGGLFQMGRRYSAGALTRDRVIKKPVAATVVIAGGGSYTLDATTGVITVVSGANPTGWAGEFDVPVIFGSDEMDVRAFSFGSDGILISWPDIEVEEVRNP